MILILSAIGGGIIGSLCFSYGQERGWGFGKKTLITALLVTLFVFTFHLLVIYL